MQKRKIVRIALILLVALVAYVAQRQGWIDGESQKPAPEVIREASRVERTGGGGAAVSIDTSAIDRAFAERRSEVWVSGEGEIVHLLADDEEGSRHQRFLLDIESGLTLKVSHNIDLAARVPVRKGDTIRFRGRYEWNDKGGVVHWTHHDPRGHLAGGWIEHNGERYE